MTQCVLAHFDRSKIGSGQRVVCVLGTGRKWVTLFYPAGMDYTKELLSKYKLAFVRDCTPKETKRVMNLVKRNAKEYDKLGLRYSKKSVKEILKSKKITKK